MNQGLTVDIGANIAGLQQALSRGLSQIQSFASGATASLGRAFNTQTFASGAQAIGNFASQAQSAGQAISIGLSLPLGAFAKRAIETYGELDSLRRGLATLEKDSTALTARLQMLNKIAELPGLGMKETIQGDIRLRTVLNSIYGIDKAAAMSQRTLQAYGNAVALVGKGKSEFDRALYGIQQLANTPFPLGEDLNIIKDAIPQVTPLLNAAFGTSRSEDFKKLKVSSQQLMEVILNGLEGLPKASGGAKNAFENFGDGATRALDKLGESLFKALHIDGLLSAVGSAITKLVDSFTNLPATTQTVVAAFGVMAIALPPLIAGIGFFTTSVLPAFRAGLAATRVAMVAFSGPIGWAAAAIAIAAVLIIANWDKVKNALTSSGVWDQLKSLVKSGLGVVTSLFGVFANLFQGDWGAMWEHITNIAKYAWNALISILGGGVLAIGGLVAKAFSLIGADDWSKAIEGRMDEVKKTIESRKFDIAAPSFNLFEGFNFGGQQGAMGKNRPGSLDGKKGKADDYFFVDYLRERVSALAKEIQNLEALGQKVPDTLRRDWANFTSELEKAELATRGIIDLGDNAKPIQLPQNRFIQAMNSANGPQLPGLAEFQKRAVEQFKKAQESIVKEIQSFSGSTSWSSIGGIGDSWGGVALKRLESNKDRIIKSAKDMAMAIQEVLTQGAAGASEAMGGFIAGLLTGAAGIDELPKVILGVFADMLQSLATAMAASAAFMLFVPGLQGQALAQFAGATGLFAVAGLSRSLANKKTTAFADGGTVAGPTYSMIGEGRGTTKSNPEWVTPVDVGASLVAKELGRMGVFGNMASGAAMTQSQRRDMTVMINVGGSFELEGDKLRLAIERAARNASV
ncbi:hypothetical protein GCM10028807_57810 [Spirosoma daeguense]